MYQYYRFYNKKGEYSNFEYNSTLDKWIGRIDMGIISEGLIEDTQIYILEEILDFSYQKNFYYPHAIIGATDSTLKIEFDKNKTVDEIFIYNLDNGDTLVKSYEIEYDLDYSINTTLLPNTDQYPSIKSSDVLSSKALQINIGFNPIAEEIYQSVLYIKDETDHIVAEITIYGEGVEEDERLRSILSSLGNDILPTDSIIFDTSNVNETNTDWKLINRKRKELLLEHHNIFPYLGSYKALINILKFYGYQNVRMKEYWKNVNSFDTKNFGKYRQTDIIDLFSTNPDPVISNLIPSKIYKKTNLFGLFYDLNVETQEFDENGIPLTKEVFTFTPEEVLIKIFALKRKLQQYYLPLNTKIVDIIGEALFFASYEIRNINSQNRIDSISLGIKPTYQVIPNNKGYLTDLRNIQYLGAPVGPDLNAGGFSNYLIYRFSISTGVDATIGSVDIGISIGGTASGFYTFFRDPRRFSDEYSIQEVREILVDSFNNPFYIPGRNTREGIQWITDNYYAYAEPDNPGVIRIVQKNPISNYLLNLVSIASGAISPYPGDTTTGNGFTAIYGSNISPGASFGATGATISLYKTAYLAHFNKFNVPINKLNDAPNIPVGYPIILKNTSFNINFDEANVTFNQIDFNSGTTASGPLYSDYTTKFEYSIGPTGWTSISPKPPGTAGATYISIPNFIGVTGFPTAGASQFNYSWDNLGYYGNYNMQWIIEKKEDETPEFYLDSGDKPIGQINEYPVSLPYVGKYNIKLFLWDLFNGRSFLIDENAIEVEMPEVDFIGWYSKRELDYTFDSNINKVQKNTAEKKKKLGTEAPKLTWNDYVSTWNLPLQPNEDLSIGEISFNSLDSIEFYQTIEDPIDNPLVDRYPYRFDLIGESATLDDTYHLWWDSTGTRITQFRIEQPYTSGPTTGIIYMTRANSTIDLLGATMNFVEGPTGWTGATGNSIAGTTGEVAYIKSNKRAYVHNGNFWKYVIDELDAIRISITGGSANKFEDARNIVKTLNDCTPITNPVICDFIYYYNEEYDSNYNLQPYIQGVSKNFDKSYRHKIKYENFSGENKSYETTYFGYLGDIPTHFEIYKVPTGGTNSFTVSYISGNQKGEKNSYKYTIGSTSLSKLCDELNGPTAQSLPVIGDFEYNMVLGSSGWTGGIGPTSFSEVKIQGISKAFVEPQQISITYSSGVIGNSFGRSLIKNPSWNDIRILKYSEEIPLLTTINFTADNCKIFGKTKYIWKLEKENDPSFENIYYNNPYFSYMFTRRGSYSLSLTIEDSNGNKNTIKKTELIKII